MVYFSIYQSSYAQLLATTTLIKLVTRTPSALSLAQRLDIRNYVLNYLATRPRLAPFVTQALVQLYARITKLGWFESIKEDYLFRNVISQIKPFIQVKMISFFLFYLMINLFQESNSVEYCIIGVQILSQLTCEVNQISSDEASRSITKQRKVASSFRDTMLFEIFQISHDFLSKALESWKTTNFENKDQQTLIHNLLRLSLSCLSFDFIGTTPDESSDDLSTVQIPTNWKPAFLDYNTLQLFFDLYCSLPPALSPLVSINC